MVKFMINIFYCDVSPLSDDILFKLSAEKISNNKKEKIDRLKVRKDKNLSLAGELILKYAFENLGYDYSQIIFSKKETGKPFLENLNLKFSISHSDTFSAVAVSEDEVGIDIEKIKDYNPAIAKKIFTENEFKKICSYENDTERKNIFFRIWTLKEAYVKMTGKSIFDFKSFEIIPDKVYLCSNIVSGCSFREFETDGYKMSVSFMDEDAKISLKKVSLLDII